MFLEPIYLFCFWVGTPQVLRLELGYSSQFSVAASFGIQDNWSSDPDKGTLELLLLIKQLPIQSFQFTPYLLAGYGGTFTIFGGPDTYTILNMGVLYELNRGIHLRPEIGITFTSKHISGGPSLFGKETPEITEERSRFTANLILEIDFASL